MSLSSPVNTFLVDNAVLARGGTWAVHDWGNPIYDYEALDGPMPRPNWGSDVGEKAIKFTGTKWQSGGTGMIFTNGQEGSAVTEYVAGGSLTFYTAVSWELVAFILPFDVGGFEGVNPLHPHSFTLQEPDWL